jgi:hypothetical protein
MNRRAGYVVAALLGLLASAPVAAANFVATAEDPAADSTDPSPGRDLTAIGLSYDRSGALFGTVRLRGEPTEETPALVTLFAGTRTASGCNGTPAAGFGSDSTDFGARWLRLDDPTGNGPRGDAAKVGTFSAVQEFEATEDQLAGQKLDCVIAMLSEPGNAANVYDTAGPLDLVAQPALALKIGGVPRKFASGRPRRIKLVLTNAGDAPTGSIRLKLSRARGLAVKAKRTVKSIPPGGRRTVTATVTLGARARTITDLKVSASAGRLKVRAETELVLRKPGGGNGGGGGGGVCTRWIPDLSGETGGSLILVPC